jgi:hypothetical protein
VSGWYREHETKGWNPWSREGAALVMSEAGRFTRVNLKTGGCSDTSRLTEEPLRVRTRSRGTRVFAKNKVTGEARQGKTLKLSAATCNNMRDVANTKRAATKSGQSVRSTSSRIRSTP